MEPDPAASTGTDGYNVQVGIVRKFAGVLAGSADAIDSIARATPRFEGWNLVPFVGIPAIGLRFVGRVNTVSDTWEDCADLLAELLTTDSKKLVAAANNYQAAEEAGTIKTA
ncbi:hypothetical protein LDL05_33915 [Nonomuraea cavernae]|uniref:hypothetical protein n=1 Tax=Nonomuraea cavernae TaxID=2045107 RepID=UPI00166B22C7|nr:hypothetical protein [Nonomuraea cavernae]MCA2190070.1 hypothetical protein [Nonomuraea cavernae]